MPWILKKYSNLDTENAFFFITKKWTKIHLHIIVLRDDNDTYWVKD